MSALPTNIASTGASSYSDPLIHMTHHDTLDAAYNGRLYVLNVKSLGAVGDGVADDSAAFAAAMTQAKAAARIIPLVSADPACGIVIEIPAGDYLITNPGAFLGDETMTSKAWGLTWRGAGMGGTNILFNPSTANQTFMSNDYWLGLRFYGISFYAIQTGCTWFLSNTTHNAQDYLFMDCKWRGWKYVIDLQGNNNNSEFKFFGCYGQTIEAAGAFFHVGTSSTSDQFLNYWFYGCKFWSTDAPFIDAAKGGSFHIFGLDVSDWGNGLSATGYLFNLRGTSHASGVCNFEALGVRVEAKNANCALLYSEWDKGSVTFHSTDWSSQAGTYTYGDIIYLYYTSFNGPVYRFNGGTLAGGVHVRIGANDWQHPHRITFDGVSWLQKSGPYDVVSYDVSSASGNNTYPPVEFIRCHGGIANDITTTTGYTTWDAVIGYRGDVLQDWRLRQLSVRDIYGTPKDTRVLTFTVPQGALITGLKVLGPAGAVTEGDGGSWTLATTEGSPTTIATATVVGAMSSGFAVSAAASPPLLCDTAAKAKLTLTPASVAQWNDKAAVIVEGYW